MANLRYALVLGLLAVVCVSLYADVDVRGLIGSPGKTVQPIGHEAATSSVAAVGWSNYTGGNYQFSYPPTWTVSRTPYGAVEVEDYNHQGQPADDEIKVVILDLGPYFNCAVARPCFQSLQDLASSTGYGNMATTTVGGDPALLAVSKTTGAMNIFVKVAEDAINIAYSPADSIQVPTVKQMLNTFSFQQPQTAPGL